ncbi:ComF family protein [Candidatus Saccharibacteria bacterium]|nr:ComF family protein [Candidatus Saccharibacteria bacterium]
MTHRNICPNCKTDNPTGSCLRCSGLPSVYTVADRSTVIGTLVHDLKYSSARAIAKPLAEVVDATLPVIVGDVTVVPLPTISRHIRERGFDHTLEIAKQLIKLRPDWTYKTILVRANDTVQVGASESNRLKQAKKAYRINPKQSIDEATTYLLIDDVWTTGASMKEAHKTIVKAGAAKTIMLALAVSRIEN